MKEITIKVLRNRYLIACILGGGLVEIIVGYFTEMLAYSIFAFLAIFLGIGLTALLAWRTIVKKSGTLTRRRAFLMALFIGLLSQIFVFVIYLLGEFAYTGNGNILEFLVGSLFWGVYMGVIFAVMFCWISIPIFYLIGYLLIDPDAQVESADKTDMLDELG